jgi:DNA polymerase-3 subunit epsilon
MIALFFDTETTGFKRADFIPEIVQIGAVVQDTITKRVLAELNVIVGAEKPIPAEVSAIHGITDELNIAFGIDSKGAENMFASMVQMSELLVAHNISFDMGIIKDVWPVAYGLMKDKEQFCTMRNAERIVGLAGSHAGGTKYPKLIEAYRHYYGKEFDNAHDAMADVRACRDVYFALFEERPPYTPDTNKQKLLDLIEKSKEKILPLTWLTEQIKAL